MNLMYTVPKDRKREIFLYSCRTFQYSRLCISKEEKHLKDNV